MNILLIYMGKVAVYFTAFYIVYILFLSRDTSYGRNRAFILLSLILGLVMPLISLPSIKQSEIPVFGRMLSEIVITGTRESPLSATEETERILYTIYITGTVAFLIKLFFDLLNLTILVMRKRKSGTAIIRYHGFHGSGFSAMGHIFINEQLDNEEAAQVIKHEQNHISKNHFLDIIFVELIKSFQWFNPVMYLIDRSLRAIHEYQADQDSISSGITVSNYQKLLLNQVFRTNTFKLSNSFSNPSLVRKRMWMMTKKRTSPLAVMKLLLVVPVVGLVFITISSFSNNNHVNDETMVNSEMLPTQSPPTPPAYNEKENEISKEPFIVVEEMPLFPGGDIALLNYIAKNTAYPARAKENNIEGRVIVKFCVTEEGGISLISIMKGVDPELDAESIRVVSTLPKFQPGRQSGKAVPVWYMVPITFALK